MLLDLMLPQVNGWELCRRLKQDPATRSVPVIMVTARPRKGDKVLGFELGADDYVTKPFSTRELGGAGARRRAAGPAAEGDERRRQLKVGRSRDRPQRFEVRMKGRAVELTPKEFELLATLAATPGRVFGREELLDLVWGRDGFVEPRTVDVHVAVCAPSSRRARRRSPGSRRSGASDTATRISVNTNVTPWLSRNNGRHHARSTNKERNEKAKH